MAWIRRCSIAVLILLGMLGGAATLAAECVHISLHVRKEIADLMFSGRVTAIQNLPDGLRVTLDVDRVWKGRVQRTMSIYVRPEQDAPTYQPGHRYVIVGPEYILFDFSDERRDPHNVPGGGCGWNIPYESAERELASLGRPHQPR